MNTAQFGWTNVHTLSSSQFHLFRWACLMLRPRPGGWPELISLPFLRYRYGSSTILLEQHIPAYHGKVRQSRNQVEIELRKKISEHYIATSRPVIEVNRLLWTLSFLMHFRPHKSMIRIRLRPSHSSCNDIKFCRFSITCNKPTQFINGCTIVWNNI